MIDVLDCCYMVGFLALLIFGIMLVTDIKFKYKWLRGIMQQLENEQGTLVKMCERTSYYSITPQHLRNIETSLADTKKRLTVVETTINDRVMLLLPLIEQLELNQQLEETQKYLTELKLRKKEAQP